MRALLFFLLICSMTNAGGSDLKMMSTSSNQQMHENILKSIGFSDQVVKSGYLTQGMKSIVQAADETQQWLAGRYPGIDICIYGMKPHGSLATVMQFYCEAKGTLFHAFRYGVGDKGLFKETLWAVHHTDELNQWIGERLAEEELTFVKADLRLEGEYGEEYAPDVSLTEILSKQMELWIGGRIYFPADHFEQDTKDRVLALFPTALQGTLSLFAYDESFDLSLIQENPPYTVKGLTDRCFVQLKGR